jgi:hypothetical protein
VNENAPLVSLPPSRWRSPISRKLATARRRASMLPPKPEVVEAARETLVIDVL